MSGGDGDLGPWLEESRVWAERQLERFVPPEDAHPASLHRAMRYALFGGGKRLRPAVVRLVCPDEQAARPAAAIELVHTYSLVHDDLPCMDDDDLRRGRPTCHVAFDEATAVLAGDALLTLAFEVVSADEHGRGAELAGILARAAGAAGMVGGQVLDLSLEQGGTTDMDVLQDMHARKTAALFAAAAEMGAVAGGADARARRGARDYGRALGLLFQAVDDVLDVTGDSLTLGKTPGKDASLERATIVTTVGLEGGRERARQLAREAQEAARGLAVGDSDRARRVVEYVLARKA